MIDFYGIIKYNEKNKKNKEFCSPTKDYKFLIIILTTALAYQTVTYLTTLNIHQFRPTVNKGNILNTLFLFIYEQFTT